MVTRKIKKYKQGPRGRLSEEPMLDENGELNINSLYEKVKLRVNPKDYENEFARPALDIVFKFIFANPRRKNLLLSLIKAIIGNKHDIKDVFVGNSEISPDDYHARKIFLDIYCTTNSSDIINLEMYSSYYISIPDKSIFYLARLHGEQDISHIETINNEIKRRDLYGDSIKHTIGISIIADGSIDSKTPYLSEYAMTEKNCQYIISDKFKLFTLELSKLKKEIESNNKENKPLQDIHWWGKFFLTNTEKELKELMNDKLTPEIIKEAAMTLEYINTNNKLKAIAHDKRMQEIVYNEECNAWRQKGFGEGQLNILTKQLSKKLNVSKNSVMEIISLKSEAELESLAENIFFIDSLEEVTNFFNKQ